ncbi:MAG: hypothetical protein ACR2FM_04985 [Candidatus Saccharimonadales bacterium]
MLSGSWGIGVLDSAVIIAIVGVLSATVGALIWIIKYLFSEFKPALDSLVKSTDQNTIATKSADVYLRDRNGRDNEFHGEVMASLKDIPIQANIQAEMVAVELKKAGSATAAQIESASTANFKALAKTIKEINQQVNEQHVEHQVIQNIEKGTELPK